MENCARVGLALRRIFFKQSVQNYLITNMYVLDILFIEFIKNRVTRIYSLKRERKASKTPVNFSESDIKKAKSLENNTHRSLGQTEEERKALQDGAIKR